MADNVEIIDSTYPVLGFRFIVKVGSEEFLCRSVSGLDQKYETADYWDGRGGLFRLLTRRELTTVTLSQAVFPGQCKLYGWLYDYVNHAEGKKDVSISLTDESGKNLFVTWNVVNAFPTGITGPSLDASTNEVAVKEITLNADRITIECHE